MYAHYFSYIDEPSPAMQVFSDWAQADKTIIICNALNCKGVLDVYYTIEIFGKQFNLPAVMFHEDRDSLNSAPTVAAIIVPDFYYDAEHYHPGGINTYIFERLDHLGHTIETRCFQERFEEYEFIKFLKSFPLV